MAQAIARGDLLALLAAIDHPDGTVYLWSGVGNLTWDGITWSSVGTLGAISPVKYSSDISIQELSFILSGLPPTVTEWVQADLRNRVAEAWLACIDRRGKVVEDPYQVVEALEDFPSFSVGEDGTATVSIVARSGFYTLLRGIDQVHSSEDQHRLYPDDTGCDLITGLQQQQIIWTPT